jgi:alpha-glucosidase
MQDFREAGAIRSWRSEGPGEVRLTLAEGSAGVAVARDGSVRLRAVAGETLPPDPAPAIERGPWRAAPAEPYPRDEGGIALAFEGAEGCVLVEIDPSPFALRVRDQGGALLAHAFGLSFESGGATRVSLAAPGEARYFGFGEKFGGLDKRGEILRMRNRDAGPRSGVDPLYVAIPFYVELCCSGGPGRTTGILLDAFAPSRLDVACSDAERVVLETAAGGLDLLVFPGPRPQDVMRRFTAWVGRCPLPPLWALGHHQSRWSYAREADVRRLAREIRERGIPTDAIHLDIDYMEGNRVFTWNRRRFPDPKGMIRDLAAAGFRVVTIVDPGVKADPGYDVYRDGLERDCFCREADGSLFHLRVWPGEAALPDFNRVEVRRWWGEQHRSLLEAGVDGIWNDMNEPAGWTRDLRIGRAILPIRRQDLSRVVQADPAREERQVPHEQVRNLYGQQQCRATRTFLETQADGRRPFLLTRSGFAGIGRYAAVWTGDNLSRWSHLRASLPMLMNLSVSGVPFCGADIGGFAGRCSAELYARWIQIGSLYPFARTHTWWLNPRQEPWRFGSRVEDIARRALELRMRLLPYLYALFREAEGSGAPIWRPLFYEFPSEREAVEVEDQVMLGAWLLAAPVLERGVREREVYLPTGVWFSFHDDARYVGPRRVRVAAPLERMPLFARGGAVLPTRSPVAHVDARPEEPLVLEVFPGSESATQIVEDDGESVAYRSGEVACTEIRLRDRAAGRLRLEIGAREGSFPVPPRLIRATVHGCPPPRSVLLDAVPLDRRAEAPGYLVQDGQVHVRFHDDGAAHALEIDPAP